jgi:hypothetical protein
MEIGNDMQQEKTQSVGSVAAKASDGMIIDNIDLGPRDGVYKLNERGDYYGCRNCSIKGDKYFMNVHTCKGLNSCFNISD